MSMRAEAEILLEIFIGIIKLAIAVFIFYEADRILNKLIEKRRRRKRTPSE